MTDTQYGGRKKVNREHKRNSIERPKARLNDKRTPERYENFNGEPIE